MREGEHTGSVRGIQSDQSQAPPVIWRHLSHISAAAGSVDAGFGAHVDSLRIAPRSTRRNTCLRKRTGGAVTPRAENQLLPIGFELCDREHRCEYVDATVQDDCVLLEMAP